MGDYIRDLRARVGRACLMVPAVRALILDEQGRVLLQRRADLNVWGLPAGAVEIGETALDALRREVFEETALTVIDAEPMGLYSGNDQRFTYPNGDEVQVFSMAFIVRRWTGRPAADGEEGLDLGFFPPDNLPPDIVAPHRLTLDDLVRHDGRFIVS